MLELAEKYVGIRHPDYRDPTHHLPVSDSGRLVIPGHDVATAYEMAQVAKALYELRVRTARENFGAFMEYCFFDETTRAPYRQQWFHDEWSTAWDTSNRCIVIAPRDSGKTSQIVGRVIWELGRNPNLRIKVACAADGRAKERLFEIVQHIIYNERVHEVFPRLRPAETGEWSKHKVIVDRQARHRDASVEALGITATATGGRCVVPGTHVLSSGEWIPIEDVRVGDVVQGADGELHRVWRKFSRPYDGPVIRINVEGVDADTVLTPEHPVLVGDDRGRTAWITAGQLLRTDRVVMSFARVDEAPPVTPELPLQILDTHRRSDPNKAPEFIRLLESPFFLDFGTTEDHFPSLGNMVGRLGENQILMEVSHISREHYKGLVHDLSIPSGRTFVTPLMTVHNCDLLIADDVVDRRNALSFPKLREQIKQAWKSDWTNLLEPDSRIWYICTLWHKDDLSHELVKNPAYDTHFYAIPDNFGSIWPEKWPSEVLYQRFLEIGSVEFNRGFRNQAIDESTRSIHPDWIHYSNLAKNEQFLDRFESLLFFTSYDTASVVSLGSDYSAMVVIAVDPDLGHVYVVDARHGKQTVAQQAKGVFSDFMRFKPYRILIEKVGQAVLDEWVVNEHPNLAPYIEVTKPREGKMQRLLAVTPLLEGGKVTFSDHLNPNSAKWVPGKENLVHELEDFPFAAHDDLVDAFSQALSAARSYVLDAFAIGIDNEYTKGSDCETYLY